jgi:putative transposase
MDLVGPRYLKGSTRLYCFNLIDTSTHAVHVEPMPSKESVEIVKAVAAAWGRLGLPDCLQMDNELAFRGSVRHPRSLGLLLRFVLSAGVVARFIPCGEPWRNGMIEKFNDTFDKRFFRAQTFADFGALKAEADVFQEFHNQHHRYSSQGGRTPRQMQEAYGPRPPLRLPAGFDPARPLPLTEGIVSFVRFIRSDGILEVLGTRFKVGSDLIYSYVVADVVVHRHMLVVSSNDVVHHRFPFVMPVDW